MLIAQITDTHIKAYGKLAYRKVDTEAHLRRTVAHINTFAPAVDAVIATGDLTDSGAPEEMDLLRDCLTDLEPPFYMIPGNHDRRDTLRRVFPDHGYLNQTDPFIQYAIDDYPIRLIGLDSTVPGKPHGGFCRARIAWLDSALAAQPTRPAFLFFHHPPFMTGIGHMDVQNLQAPAGLWEVLANHPQVQHIACGHVHRASETTINGIGVSIAPNGAHAVSLDVRPDAPSSFTLEPPSLRVFRIDDETGQVVSHLSFMGQFDGPHPFYEADGSLID